LSKREEAAESAVDKTRRWLGLLGEIRPLPDDLVEVLRARDDLAIVDWIHRQVADRRQELRDFRQSHDRYERLMRRVDAAFARLLAEEGLEDEEDDGEDPVVIDEVEKAIVSADERAELEWYEDELRRRDRDLSVWRRRLAVALDIAGIEPLRPSPGDEDDEEVP
jgi:hypothetical protein